MIKNKKILYLNKVITTLIVLMLMLNTTKQVQAAEMLLKDYSGTTVMSKPENINKKLSSNYSFTTVTGTPRDFFDILSTTSAIAPSPVTLQAVPKLSIAM